MLFFLFVFHASLSLFLPLMPVPGTGCPNSARIVYMTPSASFSRIMICLNSIIMLLVHIHSIPQRTWHNGIYSGRTGGEHMHSFSPHNYNSIIGNYVQSSQCERSHCSTTLQRVFVLSPALVCPFFVLDITISRSHQFP